MPAPSHLYEVRDQEYGVVAKLTEEMREEYLDNFTVYIKYHAEYIASLGD